MALSKRALDTLVDLVEIKLSCVEVWDQEDAREKLSLELAKRELSALLQPGGIAKSPKIRAPKREAVRVPNTAGTAYAGPAPQRLHA